MAGIYKEIWAQGLLPHLYVQGSHLAKSRNMSEYVNHDVINMATVGTKPRIIVDNNQYPVPRAQRDDTAVTIPLKKYTSETTVIPNLEAKLLSFDALSESLTEHGASLREKYEMVAAYNWTPTSATSKLPILTTTGASDGGSTAVKKLTIEDIIKMATVMDSLNYSRADRVLVLDTNHLAHILAQDVNLYKQFTDMSTGAIKPLYGFEIVTYNANPRYHIGTAAKLADGAVPTSNDFACSFAYNKSEVMHAIGSLDVAYLPKGSNTAGRADEVGVDQFFTAQIIRSQGVVTMRSVAA